MIHCHIITTVPALFRTLAAFLCMMAILSILPANAAPPNNTALPAQPVAPQPPVSAVLSETPSRYITPEDLQTYLQTVSLTFTIKKRATDPFGQQQNPDAKPIIKSTTPTTRKTTLPSQITPFADIVRRINVTTVMPKDRRFLVGDRSFKQGDRFPMKFRSGRDINVEITSVNSREISFRNLDNGESASLKLTLMPPGMTSGNGQITAPGMVRDNANSPLDIDPVSTPNPGNNFQN